MNQDKTFSKELVLLVLFLYSWEICSPVPLDAFIGAGGCLIGGGGINLCFLQIPSTSYLGIASIHSLVSGMDSCLFKIESNHDGLANTLASLVFVSMTC